MDRERIYIADMPYVVMGERGTSAAAAKLADELRAKHPCQYTYVTGRGYLVLRPIEPRSGLPAEYPKAQNA